MEFDLISDLSIVSKSLDTERVVLFNVIWSTSQHIVAWMDGGRTRISHHMDNQEVKRLWRG